MRYSTQPKFSKYVKGYGFLPFARKFGDKYCKKLMDYGKNMVKNCFKKSSSKKRRSYRRFDRK